MAIHVHHAIWIASLLPRLAMTMEGQLLHWLSIGPVIASEARQSMSAIVRHRCLDCFAAAAPRNDDGGDVPR